jgi:CRISPR-associated protein Cmr3
MSTYLIKLYPLERFYFGSDETFGDDNRNYFVRSMYFPQQTTLLGALRYALLKVENLMDDKGYVSDSGAASTAIGASGFAKDDDYRKYGKINNISPVFLTGPDGEYFVQTREYGFQWFEDAINGKKESRLVPLRVKKEPGSTSFSPDATIDGCFYFGNINSKTEIPDLLVNVRNKSMKYFNYNPSLSGDPINGLFVMHQQIGIKLEAKVKGFYKQVGYTLLPGYAFAFFADINSKDLGKKPLLIRMGADQSWFRMEFEKDLLIDNIDELTKGLFDDINSHIPKLTLISDCFVQPAEYRKAVMISGTTIPLRYFETITLKEAEMLKDIGKKEVFVNRNAKFGLSKSNEYATLLKRGSVLFFDDEKSRNEVASSISTKNSFYQIGYNYIKL